MVRSYVAMQQPSITLYTIMITQHQPISVLIEDRLFENVKHKDIISDDYLESVPGINGDSYQLLYKYSYV